MARIWQIVQWVVVRCFNCQQIWSGCRTKPQNPHSIYLHCPDCTGFVPRFYWRIFALENLFHGYPFVYFKCNAKIARWQWAEMNYVWHLTSPREFLDLPPSLDRFCIFEPPLRWRYIVPLCSIVRVHFALHSRSLLLPRGGRQINQWQRDFIVSLTEILPL